MPTARLRVLPLTLACCAALLTAVASHAETATARPAATARPTATSAAAKRPAKAPAARQKSGSLAPEAHTTEPISAAQLAVAALVITGVADCEFNQHIAVEPLVDLPGYFSVTHQHKRYRMLPRETSTGAVRLEDPDAGIVWLQIPAKSMLMNTKIGQRMVDNCTQPEQRAALDAVAGAANSLGIVPTAPSAAPTAPSTAPSATAATVKAAAQATAPSAQLSAATVAPVPAAPVAAADVPAPMPATR